MSAFDPIAGQPYGKCTTCSAVIQTEADSHGHMRQTMEEAKARGDEPRSHRVQITNAPRTQRIRSRLARIVESAIEDAMDDIDRLVDRDGIAEEEIAEALRFWSDFADARADWVEDGAS